MIQRDKTHAEQIERWANYVLENPNWKKKLTPFLDGQIVMARRAYAKLSETPDGREKIKLLRENRIRNRL
jgi:hypothetical protein